MNDVYDKPQQHGGSMPGPIWGHTNAHHGAIVGPGGGLAPQPQRQAILHRLMRLCERYGQAVDVLNILGEPLQGRPFLPPSPPQPASDMPTATSADALLDILEHHVERLDQAIKAAHDKVGQG